jgi:serine/threonine protein kinase/tetratricopeptide (TPR) repeat protein
MGVVYLGRHQETAERVAVKTVRLTQAAILASIRREVRALSRLHHPGVIRIVDHGISDERPWYAMELQEGSTLKQRIERFWRDDSRSHRVREACECKRAPLALPSSPLLKLLRRLCAPLAYLHGQGLIHRDLKPGNIFIREDDTVVLGDFGGAVEFGGAHGREVLEVDGIGMGTLLYMAPEQIRGDFVDARADLYALGCIFYECLTGVPPFLGTSAQAIRRRHLQQAPLPPSQLIGEELPERLEWLVLNLLEKRPQDRLGYAEDVARVLSELGMEADEPQPPPSPRPYLYRPLFTGREDAVSRIRPLLDRLMVGEGGSLFIGGGSGVGKTRLAMEVARELMSEELPVSVVTGECIPLGLSGSHVAADMRAPPLHPFRPLLAAVADRCRQWGPEETARLLGPRGMVLLPYAPGLDELPGQRELPPPPPLANEEAERARVFASLRDVLFAFAEEDPLLLILDDLQWADELTRSFLHVLLHEDLSGRGVLLLGTYRLEERDEALSELVSAPGALHLELGGLDEQSLHTLARCMLALDEPPRDFDRLVHQSGGNPFFVAEYLRAAIAEGLLHRDLSGQWRLEEGDGAGGPLHAVGLPGSIADIIHRRLRGLDARALALLELAAVLGREFDADLLHDAAALDAPADLEGLETLRIRQILEHAAGGRFRFLHDKLRELSYEQIAPERARPLHHRAARALEGHASRDYPTLAHHWSRAQEPDRASHYFGLAGDHARTAHAHSEALAFYRAALTELDRLSRQEPGRAEGWRERLGQLHESLGDVLSLTGQQEQARAAYTEALSRYAAEAQVRRARVHRKLGKSWETHHQHTEALRAYDEAEALLGAVTGALCAGTRALAADGWQEWLQLQVDRHWTWYWMDRREEMAALVAKVRPVVECHGTPLERARFYVSLLNTSFRQERYRVPAETVEYGRLAVEAGDASGDLATQVQTRFCHSFALLFHGALEEAEQQNLAGLRLAEQTGDLTMKSRLLTYLTVVYRKRGQVAETREACERSLEVATRARMDDYVGAALANRAWVAWREHRWEEAEQHAQAAVECWRKLAVIYPYPFQGLGLWILLAAALRRDTLAEAVAHARALLESKQQRLPDVLAIALEGAIAGWNQGQAETAHEHLRRAAGSAQQLAWL